MDDLRSIEQNRLMWDLLTDLSNQLRWPVNGVLTKLTKEEWKVVCSAGLKQQQRIAAGIDGGFVMLGASTSKMKKKEMTELIEVIYAFGAQQGVEWTKEAA